MEATWRPCVLRALLVHNCHRAHTVSTGPCWHPSPHWQLSQAAQTGHAVLWSYGILPVVLRKGPAHSSFCLHQTFRMQDPGSICPCRASLLVCCGSALTFRTCYREYTDTKMKDRIFTPHDLSSCCYSTEGLHASMGRLNENV